MAQVDYDFEKICRSCLSESNELKSLLSANELLTKWKSGVRTRHSLGINKHENITINELVMACTQVKVRFLRRRDKQYL